LPTELVQESPSHYYFLATFIDLEDGFTLPRLFKQRKSGGPGGEMASDRKEDIAFQVGQSKAQRNVINNAFPQWLRDRAMEQAKSKAADKYKAVDEWAPIAIAHYAKQGISLARLEAYLGKPRSVWSKVDVLKLNMLAKSIKDKETTLDEAFPVHEQAETVKTETAKVDPTPAIDTTGTVTSETTGPAAETGGEAKTAMDEAKACKPSAQTTTATQPAEQEATAKPVETQQTRPSQAEDFTPPKGKKP
jgi:hypothetical protein